jgi:hypothetical protein
VHTLSRSNRVPQPHPGSSGPPSRRTSWLTSSSRPGHGSERVRVRASAWGDRAEAWTLLRRAADVATLAECLDHAMAEARGPLVEDLRREFRPPWAW